MVVLPPLILGLSSILIWLLKRSQIRLLRLIIVISTFLVFLLSLLLVTQFPSQIHFTGLGPASRFALALDRDLWPIFIAISISLVLRQMFDPIFEEGGNSPYLLILFSLGMLTVSAENGFTLLAAIPAFDIAIAYTALQRDREPDLGPTLWRYYAASSLSNMILFFLLVSSEVTSKAVWMDGIATQQVLVVLFILIRGWAAGALSKQLTVHQELRSRWSLAQSIAISVDALCFVKLVSLGVVSSEGSLLSWAGALILGWSALRLLLGNQLQNLGLPLTLGLLGAILLTVSIGTEIHQTAAVQLTALSFLVTVISDDLSWLHRMERVIVVFVALVLTGLPMSLGSPISGQLSGYIAAGAISLPAAVLGIGMSLIAGGYFRHSWPRETSGELQRGFTPIVFMTSFIAACGLLRWLVPVPFDPIQITVAVGLMILGWASFRVLENMKTEVAFPDASVMARMPRIGIIDPQVWMVQIRRIIGASAQIFEGEAGSLWMFVVIQIAIVLLGLANE